MTFLAFEICFTARVFTLSQFSFIHLVTTCFLQMTMLVLFVLEFVSSFLLTALGYHELFSFSGD